jgi:predicted RNA-binding Zn-ribbon protein involved in translation (DUF1610 family)
MTELILERKYDYGNRLFALCESCYWTATIFTKMESYECPACHAGNVALIPLSLAKSMNSNSNQNRVLILNSR